MAKTPEQKLHKAFTTHTNDVKAFIVLLDHAARTLKGEELGRRLADLSNKLEMRNDLARRYALELDFNGKPLKRAPLSGEKRGDGR